LSKDVEVAVDVVRRNVGVVRAASQYESIYPERWGTSVPPEVPWSISATAAVAGTDGTGPHYAKMRSIGFAFQMMFGTLV